MADWWASYWQLFAGTGIGVVVTLIVAWFQREPKRLDYEVIDNISLLSSTTGDLRDRFHVTYKHAVVENPRIATVRIINTGKRAIEASEYETPVTIRYENEENGPFDGFISAVSNEDVRSDMPVTFPDGAGSVQIQPGLLNKGEWIEIRLISDGPSGEITATSRFPDRQHPMGDYSKVRQRAAMRADLLRLLVFMAISGTMVFLVLFWLER